MNTRWVLQFHALIYKIWINYAKPPRKIPVIISPKKRIWRPVVVSAGLIYLADVVCLHLGNVGGPLSPASSGNLADAPVQPIARKERPRAHNNFWSSPETLGISCVALPPIQQRPAYKYYSSVYKCYTQANNCYTIVILQPSNIILKQTNIVRQRENGELMHFTNLKTIWSNEMTSFFYAL